MQVKKMTLRFDLDRPDDRQAWEYLQRQNPVSINRAVISIINQAEKTDFILNSVRTIIREELSDTKQKPLFQPASVELADDEMDATIIGFLESFS